MIAVKEDQERANSRRQKEQPVLAEAIRQELASAIPESNLVLVFLVVTI